MKNATKSKQIRAKLTSVVGGWAQWIAVRESHGLPSYVLVDDEAEAATFADEQHAQRVARNLSLSMGRCRIELV